uniref:Xylulose kinase-1 n=1 Tax=Tanacetum cinerariifolium TaxID=118510 RepID=A0A6L2K9Y2_TANCI|nr:hypothetical protein [Tanacetum cinerariifolium]
MTLTFAETHNMIAYLIKSNASEGCNQIIDFLNGSSIKYALTVNLNIYVSCIKQFWTSVAVKKVNDVMRLQALVDKKKIIITESSIRDALRLDDEEGKGFSRVETPLFEEMIVAQEVVNEGYAEVNIDDVPAVGFAAEGDVSTADDVVPIAVEEPSIPSPTPPTPPTQPSQDQPSTSQDNIAQALEITKSKSRVKKLERKNKASKLKRLKRVGTAQRIDTSDDTIIDDVSKQRRMIADINKDVDVSLEVTKEVEGYLVFTNTQDVG